MPGLSADSLLHLAVRKGDSRLQQSPQGPLCSEMLLPLLLAASLIWQGPNWQAQQLRSLGGRGGKGEGQADPSSGSGPGSLANDGPPCWLAPAHHPPLAYLSSSLDSCPPTKGNSGDPPPPSPAKRKTCRGGAAAGKARITEPEKSAGPCSSARRSPGYSWRAP